MQGFIRESKTDEERKVWEGYGSPLQQNFRLSDGKTNGHFSNNIYNQTKTEKIFYEIESQQHKTIPMSNYCKPETHSISQPKFNILKDSPNTRGIYDHPSYSKYEDPSKFEQAMEVETNENSPKSEETRCWSQSQFLSEKTGIVSSDKMIQNRSITKEEPLGFNQNSRFEKIDDNERKNYEAKIFEKNAKINKLVERLTDESKKAIQEEANSFIESVLKANAELQNELHIEINKNKQNKKTIQDLETENHQLRVQCEKIENSKIILERDLTNEIEKRSLKDEEKTNCNSPNYFLIEGLKRKIKQLELSLVTLSEECLKLKRKNIESQEYYNNELREGLLKLKKEKIDSHQSFLKLSSSISNKEIENNLLRMKLQGYDRKIEKISEEMKLKTILIEKIGLNMKPLLDGESKKEIMLAMEEVLNRFKSVEEEKKDYEKEIQELKNKIDILSL